MLGGMPELPSDPAVDPAARAGLEAWRASYRQRLAAPTGWWAVSNLAWVDDDPCWLGGAEDDDLRAPARVAARLALVERIERGLRVTPSSADALTLDGAALPGATEIHDAGARLTPTGVAGVEVVVAERNGRWGVRVYDAELASARADERLGWFDPTPGWCVAADVEPGDGLPPLVIVDALGNAREVAVAARLRFVLAGAERTLLAHAAGGSLFVNFRDASNGAETYAAGRFLVVDAPVHGRAVLDFHRAHHPPCAHTPHAMCPLPPLANRLDLAVRAGERYPDGD
jgi:uncharacterized protein